MEKLTLSKLFTLDDRPGFAVHLRWQPWLFGTLAGVQGMRKKAWWMAAASGVLQVLIYPTSGLSFLCWVAFTPLLLAVLRARLPESMRLPASLAEQLRPASLSQGFLIGWLSGVIGSAGTCYWIYHVMHVYGGLSGPLALGVLVLFCLALGAHNGLFGLMLAVIARDGPGPRTRLALVCAPFLWVAVELFRCRVTSFLWNPLGTVQVDNIPLALISRATGVWGMSFEIMLVNVAFAAAFLVPRRSRRFLLVTTGIVAAAVQCGVLVGPAPLAASETARLVQHNIPILDQSQWTWDYYRRTVNELAQLSLSPTPSSNEPKPGLIIWPESPAPFYFNDPGFQNDIAQMARQSNAYVIAGVVHLEKQSEQGPPTVHNSAALVTPGGEWKARYDKIHLVPFGEYVPFASLLSFAQKLTREVGDFIPGTTRNTFHLGHYDAGVLICYESIFPGEVRQFVANGAQVLINISNDGWFGHTAAPWQHLNQARMRAIENSRWLLRATNTGITVAIDPFGRVVAQAQRDARTAIDVSFSPVERTTFYTRHGDWFPYACAIITVAALLASLPRKAISR